MAVAQRHFSCKPIQSLHLSPSKSPTLLGSWPMQQLGVGEGNKKGATGVGGSEEWGTGSAGTQANNPDWPNLVVPGERPALFSFTGG